MDTPTAPPVSDEAPSLDQLHRVLTQIARGVEGLAGRVQELDHKLAQVLGEGRGPLQEYLSIQQAAAVAGLSPTKIRREIKAGRLPASNAGTCLRPLYRIQREDLEAWLRTKKGESEVPPKVPVHKRKIKSRYFGDI